MTVYRNNRRSRLVVEGTATEVHLDREHGRGKHAEQLRVEMAQSRHQLVQLRHLSTSLQSVSFFNKHYTIGMF